MEPFFGMPAAGGFHVDIGRKVMRWVAIGLSRKHSLAQFFCYAGIGMDRVVLHFSMAM